MSEKDKKNSEKVRTTVYLDYHCKLYAKMTMNLSDEVNRMVEKRMDAEDGKDKFASLLSRITNPNTHKGYCEKCKTVLHARHPIAYCPNCNGKLKKR